MVRLISAEIVAAARAVTADLPAWVRGSDRPTNRG
jgi:hypothetical protein